MCASSKLAGLRVGIAQQTEVSRNADFRPRGPEGTEPLQKNRQRFLASALQEQSRPLVKRAQRVPERKALFGRESPLPRRRRLDLGSEPAVVVKKRREVHGMAKAERVADGSPQLTHLANKLEGLIRVAEMPQGQREVATVSHAGVVPGIGGPELRALAVVVGSQRLLVTGTGIRELGRGRTS